MKNEKWILTVGENGDGTTIYMIEGTEDIVVEEFLEVIKGYWIVYEDEIGSASLERDDLEVTTDGWYSGYVHCYECHIDFTLAPLNDLEKNCKHLIKEEK